MRPVLAFLVLALPLVWPGKAASASHAAAERPDPERTNLAALVQSCRKCHEDVCAEWEGSAHRRSWTDPVFQAEIAEREDAGEACAPCHAPADLRLEGFGKLPRPRKLDRELGVNCVTCHLLGNEYHGPYDSPGHGGVIGDPAYRRPGLCLSCHGQPEARAVHDQGSSFLAGPAAAEGRTCQECHMRAVDRKLVTNPTIRDRYTIGVQPCRTHDFRGAREGSLLEGAARVQLRAVDPGSYEVAVTPATGHTLPASTGRRLVLRLVEEAPEGTRTEERVFRVEDGTALRGGLETRASFPRRPEATSARVVLEHVIPASPGRKEPVLKRVAEAVLP
jgi:hypothetical protein